MTASPFPAIVKAAAKASKKTHRADHIDPELLSICNDPLPSRRVLPDGKYNEIFSQLRSGQCIKCEPDEVSRLSNALRSWLSKRDRAQTFLVRSVARYPKDGRGRVWLIAKEQKLKAAA